MAEHSHSKTEGASVHGLVRLVYHCSDLGVSPGESQVISLVVIYLPNRPEGGPIYYLQIRLLIRRAVIPACMQNVGATVLAEYICGACY